MCNVGILPPVVDSFSLLNFMRRIEVEHQLRFSIKFQNVHYHGAVQSMLPKLENVPDTHIIILRYMYK